MQVTRACVFMWKRYVSQIQDIFQISYSKLAFVISAFQIAFVFQSQNPLIKHFTRLYFAHKLFLTND